ncbi:MAG TPA: hypothetical protein ENG42_03515 [Candidatus Aenigmarchaeota archaeon]|nr:hypothetical protein [Candidatus Aenigmarchaeota archaeon]
MRSGAIQMSLGFIIAVVFAIVLLSLAIWWLRGVIINISGLTTDLTQQARNELQRTFGGTGENFAIFPSSYELEAGKGIRMLGGIKNNAADGQDHRFVINVVPSAASPNVCPEGDISECELAGGGGITLEEFMTSWLTWDKTKKPIKIGQTGEFWLEIKTPANTPKGTYMFNVYACYDSGGEVPRYDECNEDTPTDKIWGAEKQLVITVK